MDDAPHFTGSGDGRRTAPDDVWAQVREAYLSGVSAPECCRRHGVGLSALRARAADEGWRRIDQPWPLPNTRLDPDDEGLALEERVNGDLDQIPLGELALVAFRRMMRAVLHGDAAEALRWRRVRLAVDAEDAHLNRLYDRAQRREARAFGDSVLAAARADYEAALADYPDASDASDGVFPSGPTSEATTGFILPGLPVGRPTAPP